MSESFFSKTAKFKPSLLKSSVGKLNQLNVSKKANHSGVKPNQSFANTLNNTISQTKLSTFNKQKNSIHSIHEVKAGETLTHIALRSMRKAGLKIESKGIMQTALELAKFNGIKNPRPINLPRKR